MQAWQEMGEWRQRAAFGSGSALQEFLGLLLSLTSPLGSALLQTAGHASLVTLLSPYFSDLRLRHCLAKDVREQPGIASFLHTSANCFSVFLLCYQAQVLLSFSALLSLV